MRLDFGVSMESFLDVFRIAWEYRDGFLRGIWVTTKLCLLIWPVGILSGSILGMLGYHYQHTIGRISHLLSFLLTGIPILVLLFWFHYPAQMIAGIQVDPFWTAVVSISLVNMVSVSDIVRSSLDRFPSQYILSASMLGLSTRDILFRIRYPIVLRMVFPAIIAVQVVMLQATLFASLISVDEVFRVAQQINSQIYRPVEIYSALAIMFLIICLPINGVAFWLRRKFKNQLQL